MLHFYLNKKILRYFSGILFVSPEVTASAPVKGQKTWLQKSGQGRKPEKNSWTSRDLVRVHPVDALQPHRILSLSDSANPDVSKLESPALTRKLTRSETRAFPLNSLKGSFIDSTEIGERKHLDILTAVQTRNIPRFLFLFLLSLMSPLSSAETPMTRTMKLTTKTSQLHQRISEMIKQSLRSTSALLRQAHTTTRLGTGLKPGFTTATLCIPYLFLTGMVLTCIQLFQHNIEFGSRSVRPSPELRHSADPALAGTVRQTFASFAGRNLTQSFSQKTTNFYSFTPVSAEMRRIRGLSTKKISDFCLESLRITPVCSKLFLLWALLQIWRGIRPGQSSLVDTRVQLRIVAPEENTKSLRGVQGIEKYHDILQGCVQSFRMNSSSAPLKHHFSLRSFFLRFFGFDLFATQLRFGPARISWSRHSGLAPKAYLFLGPPGSGKTLCAQALAGDAEVPLLCLSASEIQKQVESGTKIGPLRVRNLFQQTRTHTPCILFLDEIDSLSSSPQLTQAAEQSTSKRAHSASISLVQPFTKLSKERKKFQESSTWSPLHIQNSLNLQFALRSPESNENMSTLTTQLNQSAQKNSQSDSMDRTLVTEFLIQMDSFSIQDGFCLIGTTNFLDALDSAFIRSGRFDRLLALSLPGKKSRQALFEFYSRGALRVWPGTGRYSFQQPSTMDWKYWAEQTQGFSAAEIAKIMNESFLHVIHTALSESSKSPFVKLDHTPQSIQKGIQTIVMSPRALGMGQQS